MLGTERGCCANALPVVVIEGWIFVFHKFRGEAPLAPSKDAVVQPGVNQSINIHSLVIVSKIKHETVI